MTNDQNNAVDIFVFDVPAMKLELASSSLNQTSGAERASSYLEVSRNGRYILFQSKAGDLAAMPGRPAQNRTNLFLRDVEKRSTTLITPILPLLPTPISPRAPSATMGGE